jgi:hypothetical protein
MSQDIIGIHHVTAITSDPQLNLDISGVKGLTEAQRASLQALGAI